MLIKASAKVAGLLFAVAVLAVAGFTTIESAPAASAACSPPTTTYGTDTLSVAVPSAGSYVVWVRLQAPAKTSNSMMLEVDGGQCYNVGGSATMPLGSWTWVNYQNGSSTQVMQTSLTAGNHRLKLIGTEPGVAVDNVLLLSATSCIPTGLGTNCTPLAVPPPTTPTGLSATATSPTSVSLNWSPSTDSGGPGIGGYYLFRTGASGSVRLGPVTGTSFVDTTADNTTYNYSVEAFDTANPVNTSTPSAPVSVTTPVTPPTVPTGLTVTAPTSNQVNLSWTASTDSDSLGVSGYYVLRSTSATGPFTTIANVTATSYSDSSVTANTNYYYEVEAYVAATPQGLSAPTAVVTVKTPNPPDTNPPTVPTNLVASVLSSSQINLSWTASSDNRGVKDYAVLQVGVVSPIAIVTGTNYGVTGLNAATTYQYSVVAYDGAGNRSAASNIVTATTQPAIDPTTVTVYGQVTDSRTGLPLTGVAVKTGGIGADGSAISATTDSTGLYLLSGIRAKRPKTYVYKLKGYQSAHTKASYTPGRYVQNVPLVGK